MPLATLAEHSWFYIIWKRVCLRALDLFDLGYYYVTLLQADNEIQGNDTNVVAA